MSFLAEKFSPHAFGPILTGIRRVFDRASNFAELERVTRTFVGQAILPAAGLPPGVVRLRQITNAGKKAGGGAEVSDVQDTLLVPATPG